MKTEEGMFRRLKILLISLFATLTSMAQVSPQEGQAWWGMWNTEQGLAPAATYPAGFNSSAIRLMLRNHPLLGDAKVHGMRFYISDKTAVTSARIWLSQKSFNKESGMPDMAVKDIPLGQLRDWEHDRSATEVLFDEPVSILPSINAYSNLYAGFVLAVGEGPACQMMTAEHRPQTTANSNFYDWTAVDATYGPLAVQLLVSSDRLKARDISPLPLGDSIAVKSEQQSMVINMPLQSLGTQTITDLDYTLRIGQSETVTRHYVFPSPITELGAMVNVPVEVTLPADACVYNLEVDVTKVNGLSNESAKPTTAGTMIVLEQRPVKRSVMEEFTGTWCTNCPRGMVGMRLLEEQFADRFIGIAVHNDDPMTLREYDQSKVVRAKVAALGGYPSCSIDREVDCDPYLGMSLFEKHFQTNTIVEYLLNQKTVADVSLQAAWSDEQDGVVNCKATTTFWYSDDKAPFALMLVITADSLCGEGSVWLQRNTTIAGSTGWDADMDQFTLGEPLMKIAYDHVPIAVAGVEQGIRGSIAAPLQQGEQQHYSHSFDLSGNALVQNPQKLHAIAMLIDSRTGFVVNVAKTHVADGAQGVAVATASDVPASYYSLDGRRLVAKPQRGLYIEKRKREKGKIINEK